MYVEEQRSTVSSVEHTVRGTLEEVLAWAKDFFGDYHPLGYGSAIRFIGHTSTIGVGPYELRATRAKSCD